ncbi:MULTISPECIES: hypothetical protein [Legionella]|uniref:Substrate of the Dot/Icm secretion system n=1 Tax=Legionella drozanskii LLAP-1 TaxID=1212489 RepID=A0A0W0SRL2_9GAMM|nr:MULTISPECIES: hypothetical protein [Legionella]KTC86000.1 hypothetical protein Ldro_2325 [Legionella drozanskii LLAP-1]PJE09902.1 MAG: hypothetical protein CK430_10740 [Legionella sp.]
MGDFVIRPYSEQLNGSVPKEGQLRNPGFVHAIEDLRRKHGKVLTVEELPPHRKYQAQFLNRITELFLEAETEKLMELLCESDRDAVNKLTEQEQQQELLRGIIFTSLSTLVAAEIATGNSESIMDPRHVEGASTTYKGGYIGDGSEFFRGLLASSGRTKENEMSHERMQTFMQTAKNFIESYVYVPHEHMDKQSTQGFREKHAFSDIQDLDVSAYLKLSSNIILEASLGIVERNVAKQAEDLKARKEEELKRAKEEHEAQLARVKEEKKKEREMQKLEDAKKGGSSWGLTDYLSSFGIYTTPKPAPTAASTTDPSNRQDNAEPAPGATLN